MIPGQENLKPCKPGETHNPNGRPKGTRNVGTVLKELLAGLDPKDKRWETPLAKKLIQIAFAKNPETGEPLANIDQTRRAINDILDRIEGKAVQRQEIEQTTDDIKIILADDRPLPKKIKK